MRLVIRQVHLGAALGDPVNDEVENVY